MNYLKLLKKMGDTRRFHITAEFIQRNYPKANSILCVADGKGDLARILQKQGRNAQIIDPVYNGLFFTRDWKHKCDLIVGLHPDEATAEIVLAGEKLIIPYLIVPCCVKGQEAKDVRGLNQWYDKLYRLSGYTLRQTQLPFKGANIIMFK